jgi:hypothetical protein
VKLKIKNDFSWRMLLAVLALHLLVVMGFNAAVPLPLAISAKNNEVQAFIVPLKAPVITSVARPNVAVAKPMEPVQVAVQAESAASSAPTPETIFAALTAAPEHYAPPASMRLLYSVTKGDESAKASLTWRTQNHAEQQTSYELTYEATYFGISVQKQTSVGLIGEGGLAPVRFGDKRRGRPEQATHFDSGSQRVTFSNNHPEAALAMGSQDRCSVLIQLASLFAAQPNKWTAGQVIEMPVASADELETWRWEVQGTEVLALPAGDQSAVHLIRRARRSFDQTVELWLAPSLGFVPVRMRLLDANGVVDAQLLGSETL